MSWDLPRAAGQGLWAWEVRGLGVAGQGFSRGRSGVWTWQVKGFGCGRSRVWAWQAKGKLWHSPATWPQKNLVEKPANLKHHNFPCRWWNWVSYFLKDLQFCELFIPQYPQFKSFLQVTAERKCQPAFPLRDGWQRCHLDTETVWGY